MWTDDLFQKEKNRKEKMKEILTIDKKLEGIGFFGGGVQSKNFLFFFVKNSKKKKKKKKIKNQRILINQVSFRFICDVTFDVFNQKPAAQWLLIGHNNKKNIKKKKDPFSPTPPPFSFDFSISSDFGFQGEWVRGALVRRFPAEARHPDQLLLA